MKLALYISGVADVNYTRTVLLLKAFSARGFKAGAICPGSGRSAHENGGILHFKVRRPSANFWYDRGVLNTARACMDRAMGAVQIAWHLWNESPELIICSEPDCWLLGYVYKLLVGCILVTDLREVYDDRALAFPTIARRAIRQLIRLSMVAMARNTDAILHVSEERRAVYEYLGTPGVVVACYPELSVMTAAQSKGVREPISGTHVFTAIHVGALRSTYASDQLLRAVAQATSDGLAMRLIVLGGVAGEIEEFELLSRLRNSGVVDLYEHVPFSEVRERMAIADVGISLVLPIDTAHRLAQPQKLYEYLAAGLPVVGANVPTIRRVLELHACGLTVDPYCVNDIVSALKLLATDRCLMVTMGGNARRAAASSYNWEIESHRLFEIIEALRLRCGNVTVC